MIRTLVGNAKRLPAWTASTKIDRVTADLTLTKPRYIVSVGQNVFAQFHCSEYSTSSDDTDEATSATSKGAFVRMTFEGKLRDQYLKKCFQRLSRCFVKAKKTALRRLSLATGSSRRNEQLQRVA